MKTVLVTGATGLVASNVCTRLVRQGDRPRAIVRDPSSAAAQALQKAGVEIVPGDISDRASVCAAAKGVDGVIHSAAMLGREGERVEDAFSTNVIGTINILVAAADAGNIPVVQLLTTVYFDMWDKTLTEFSPLDLLCRNTDPLSLTKRLAYVEGVARVDAGQDIRFVIPGAVYGPSVCVARSMVGRSFNDRIARAIRGGLEPLLPFPMPFSSADDCAYVCVTALERGRKGERYLAHGRKQDVSTMAVFYNRACEIAGVTHRVADIPREKLDSPELLAKFGPTMPTLAKRTYPTPFSDSTFTQERLGYVPTSVDDGLRATIAWMRSEGII
jgi:nucleoside-diphosphate-sugar epimerase